MLKLINSLKKASLCTCAFASFAMHSTVFAQTNTAQNKAAASAVAAYQTLDLKQSSLRLVDADAAVYSAGFQLQQQWTDLINGPFVQQVLQTPIGQKVTSTLQEQWNTRSGKVGELRSTLSNPNVQSLLSLLQDFSSDEVFLYGDQNLPNTLTEVSRLSRDIQMLAADGDIELVKEYLQGLRKDETDAIKIPTLILGGKISDKAAVLQKLDELEAIITFGLSSIPNANHLLDGLERTEDNRGTRISLTLSSAMIPWEDIPTNGNIDVEDIVDQLHTLLEDRQISIIIGMLDHYLVFGISESQDQVATLGSSDSLLDHDHLELVRSKEALPILAINYLSDDMADANFEINLSDYFTRNITPLVNEGLEQQHSQLLNDDLDDRELEKIEAISELLETIPEDLQWIDDQIAEHVPEFRGQTAVSVAHADGNESWTEYRTENVALDSQEELPILEHLGGDPLAFFAGRRQYHPEYFETCRSIVRKVRTYLERAADSKIVTDDEEEKLNLFLERGWPLLVELADTIEQDFIPATEDGQFAFVLNAPSLFAKQWFKDMPASEQELPLIEVAEIVGVNDASKFTNGFERLFAIGDQIVEFMREEELADIPEDYTIPRPMSAEATANFTKYFYPIPEDCPVPQSMAPQALIGEGFSYFGYSQAQIDALSKSTALTKQADFIDEKETLSSIAFFDIGRISTAFRPWFQYALKQAGDELIIPAQEGFPEFRTTDLDDLYNAISHCGEVIAVESGNGEDGSILHVRYFRQAQ